MRLLEKGFGCCSLRSSTIVVLLTNVITFGLAIMMILFNFDTIARYVNSVQQIGFFQKLGEILLFAASASVFFYTFLEVLKHSSSMLTVATVLSCVYSFLMVVGFIMTIELFPFSDLILIFISSGAIAVFELYSAWILYSYKQQFSRPVRVNV